jgi:hypothetical protein
MHSRVESIGSSGTKEYNMGLRCSTAARQHSGLWNAGMLSIPDTSRAKFAHVLSMLICGRLSPLRIQPFSILRLIDPPFRTLSIALLKNDGVQSGPENQSVGYGL